MRQWWALLIAAAGAIVLAMIATTPPAPVSADAPEHMFSARRAMVDVRAIARAPRPTGSAENARVRAYLGERLRRMELTVTTPVVTLDRASAERLREWNGQARTPRATNILGRLPGRDARLPAVLLMAHYDSVWRSPGAADDAAGVAALLEVVRALRAVPRARDLIMLLTDGEELGLSGAKAFFAQPAPERIGVVINLESRGGGGRAQMFETGVGNGGMMRLFGAAVARPAATSLSVFIYQKLPNSTDFTPAKRAGHPGFNFAFIGRPGLYHSPLATPDALDQGSVQDIGGQVLDLTRALIARRPLPGRAADLTFFDAFGLFLVSYAPWWGWVLLAAAAALYGAAMLRQPSPRDLWRGAGTMLVLLPGSAMLLYLVNLLSGADGKVNYYDRLAAIPRLEGQALLLCLAALVLASIPFAQRRGGTAAAGAALPIFMLAAAAQALAPTAAYPFAWPLLFGGAAAAVGAFGGERAGRVVGTIGAMLGVGYLLGFGVFLLQAVAPKTPMVAAVPLALSALLLSPLLPRVERRPASILAALLIVAACGIALWVRLDPIAASVPAYSNDK